MRGVVLLGDRECCVKEFPDPVPGSGQVRVKMISTGICGSDLHLYRISKEQAQKRGDRIPGHEPSGIVDALGHGVKKDTAEALKWFTRAAQHGHDQARKKLAEMCYRGEGTGDIIESWKWLLLAEDHGQDMKELRKILETELTAEQKEEAKQRAEAFRKSYP